MLFETQIQHPCPQVHKAGNDSVSRKVRGKGAVVELAGALGQLGVHKRLIPRGYVCDRAAIQAGMPGQLFRNVCIPYGFGRSQHIVDKLQSFTSAAHHAASRLHVCKVFIPQQGGQLMAQFHRTGNNGFVVGQTMN